MLSQNPEQVTHFLESATSASVWLRRASDPVAVLVFALQAAGNMSDEVATAMLEDRDISGCLVWLAEKGAPEGHEASSFLEWFHSVLGEHPLGIGAGGPMLMNRGVPTGDPEPLTPAEQKIVDLVDEADQADWTNIWDGKTGSFSVLKQHHSIWYVREGKRLCGESKPLPRQVSVLLTYPLGRPHVFTWEPAGDADRPLTHWNIAELLEEIAAQYALIYEQPDKYGIWGHDIGDLVVEALRWCESANIICPSIGS